MVSHYLAIILKAAPLGRRKCGVYAIMPPMLAPKKILRFRRYHGYDYSRGAVLFITYGHLRRQPVFGHVAGSKVAY